MVNLEVLFLVFWMELSWAIKMRLYLAYLAIPFLFHLLSSTVQSASATPSSLYFLPSAIALAFLFTSFLIIFGFVQKGKSFWNLCKLSGSPPLYIFLGELSFTSLVTIIQAILFFLLVYIFSRIGSLASFPLLLITSFLFTFLYTLFFLLLSLPLKFKPLDFLYVSSGFLLLSLFLSNIFLPVYSLPPLVRYLVLLNPLTYGVEGFNWALGARSSLSFFSPGLFFGLYLTLSILCLYSLTRSSTKD